MATQSAAKKSGNKWVTMAIEISILTVGIGLALMMRAYIYESAILVSRSMEPTLLVGDRVIVDHRATLSGQWQRGDIIMFDPPESWGPEGENERLTKRIIGLPGETIDVESEGRVLINGQPLNEDYVKQNPLRAPIRLTLGETQYFVMGDNRTNSEDSRDNGPIFENNIRGRLVRIFWPPGRMGGVQTPNY